MRTQDQVSKAAADIIVRYADRVNTQDTLEDIRFSYSLSKGEMNTADAFRALTAIEAATQRVAEIRNKRALNRA